MKHSKVTQKLNDKIIKALDAISALASEELEGFVSISHTEKFDCFPASLLVDCHFDSVNNLEQAKLAEQKYQKILQNFMLKQGIILKNPSHHLRFTLSSQ